MTENGVLKVADGKDLIGSPLQSPNNWWHILAGSHTNTQNFSYYLAFPLEREGNDFWYQKKINGVYYTWKKFIGFEDLNNNGLFREWNLEHGLSTYIGNSDVYSVWTKFSGQGGDLLFSLNNEKAYFSKRVETNKIHLHKAGASQVTLRTEEGNKLEIRKDLDGDFTRVIASGYEIPQGVHTRLLTANGENYGLGVGQKQDIDLTGLDESKYYLVYCIVEPKDRVKVRVQNALDWTSKPSWSTHEGGFSLNLEFEQTGAGWGANHIDLNITQYSHLWTTADPVMYVGQNTNSSKMFMYLRGGGIYTIYQWSQIGNSNTWYSPRKNIGDFVENGVSLLYCRDWDANLKVVATNIRSYRDSAYGEVTKIYKPVVTRELFLDNDIDSETNLWTYGNELFVGSVKAGGHTKINTAGYKIVNKNDNYILTAGGNSVHRKDLIGRVIDIKASTFNITPEVIGYTAHIYNNCSLNYNTMPLSSSFAVRKIFDGGEVKFTGGVEAIYTGDRVLNGKKGSTAIIDYGSEGNIIFVDIRNV